MFAFPAPVNLRTSSASSTPECPAIYLGFPFSNCLEMLAEAMKLGKLGEQIVLKSEKAFESITFVQSHRTDNMIYYPIRTTRDRTAREEYLGRLRKFDSINSTYMIDIIRDKWTNDDERLQ